MRLKKTWTVASKDFLTFKKKRSLIYSLIGFQVFVGLGLPAIVEFVVAKRPTFPAATLPALLNSFSFWFAIGATFIPMGIASYSILGEKIQKSLEPLLATPVTDEELLLGKGVAAFLPTIIATYIGVSLFMLFMDVITQPKLGYWYYPNWFIGILMLLLVPLACILSIEINVLISARFNDLRSAQSFAILMFLPFIGVYVLSEIGVFMLTIENLLILSAVVLILDVALFFATRATFQREEILTRWR
jgi:ABC-2 type transport system permease protein